MIDPKKLAALWRIEKGKEQLHRARRLEIEQELLALLDKPETHEGTEELAGLKVGYKMSQKVDAKELWEVAERANIPETRIREIFRWKPEVDAREWKAATEQERGALSRAITIKPAKPSFREK